MFAYYYSGCRSWHWYYPYHYAPFASDLLGCDGLEVKFEPGQPATPFEQLLAVFPAQSSHAVPACYRKLYDADSPIIDFYPREVRLDINGARYAWMGVNLLPFIDRQRLVKAMLEADDNGSKLTAHERERNRRSGDIKLLFRPSRSTKESAMVHKLKGDAVVEASFKNRDPICGKITCVSKGLIAKYGDKVDKSCGNLILKVDECACHIVNYEHPPYERHLTSLLPGAKLPRREVEDFAIYHIKRRVF